VIGIPLGLLYANTAEWLLHKHVLHGRGRDRRSFWAFHFHEHHQACWKHDFRDPNYARSLLGWHAQSKEALSLVVLAATHVPLLPVAPFFTGTVLFSAWDYYRKHKRAHLDPEWAKEHLPWHYDHHMGPNPEANWGVTHPWLDELLGTRERFLDADAHGRLEAPVRGTPAPST